MAARRLIALLVVLLVISSIAAALTPTPAERDGSTTSTAPTTTESTDRNEPGKLIEATVDAPPSPGSGSDGRREPETIEASVGDQLALTVRSERTTAIEIPALGLLETAAPGGPARFDLLLREPGRLSVRTQGGEQLARVVVDAEARDAKRGRQGGGPEAAGPGDEGSGSGPGSTASG